MILFNGREVFHPVKHTFNNETLNIEIVYQKKHWAEIMVSKAKNFGNKLLESIS